MKMTRGMWLVVVAFAVMLGAPERLIAGSPGSLTGHGSAEMRVTSASRVTDVRLAVDFEATSDARGQLAGSFDAKPKSDADVMVTIDGIEFTLDAIRGDIMTGEIPSTLQGAYRLGVIGTVDVSDRVGRSLSFDAVVSVTGATGGHGQPIDIAVAVGPQGQRGAIAATGTWTTGVGAKAVIGFGNSTHLVNGCYSGELHGEIQKFGNYSAVLVVCFDGAGGILSGRVEQKYGNGFGTVEIAASASSYTVDLDGLGPLLLATQVVGYRGSLAVAQQGKVIKLAFHTIGEFNTFFLGSVVGELLKQ